MDKETLSAMGIDTNKSNEDINKCQSYMGVYVLCFLLPILGFIGYITHIKNDYRLAKGCLQSAICGLVIYVIALILIFNS